ncbi:MULTISPECIES: hypothetical protein [Citrobacter]|uniref:hypothetical protein n=1 Tax=Citrobacter TaxID=544 RepID=UPI001F1F2A9F|nr:MULTISPECIES: hypothetical protein [Citrobacter]
MFKKVFSGAGDFQAWNECKNWLDKHGYSYGSTSCRATGVGVLKGDYCIAKMHNLTKQEVQELDGIVDGNFRNGPVVLKLKVAPEGISPEAAL